MKVSARIAGIGAGRTETLVASLRQRALAKLEQRLAARRAQQPIPRKRGER
jgi:hypothetical protein